MACRRGVEWPSNERIPVGRMSSGSERRKDLLLLLRCHIVVEEVVEVFCNGGSRLSPLKADVFLEASKFILVP